MQGPPVWGGLAPPLGRAWGYGKINFSFQIQLKLFCLAEFNHLFRKNASELLIQILKKYNYQISILLIAK
jgi:hypothetical protein